MKEWDQASYHRKWLNTVAILFNPKENKYLQGVITGINKDFWDLFTKDEIKKLDFNKWEPVYKHIPSGWVDSETVLYRKNAKTFNVGLNSQSHVIGTYVYNNSVRPFRYHTHMTEWPWSTLKLLELPRRIWLREEKEHALKAYGPISMRLFLGKTEIFYLNQYIGMRAGKDFKLHDKFANVKQELYDALREVL